MSQGNSSGGFNPFATFQQGDSPPASQPDDELHPGQVLVIDGERYVVQAEDAAKELVPVPMPGQQALNVSADEPVGGSSQEVIFSLCLNYRKVIKL